MHMTDPVTLRVPLDESFRELGPDLARKYLEIVGGSAQDAGTLAAALTAALARLAGPAGSGGDVAITLSHERASVEARIECGVQTATVTQPLPAAKS
jgi:hypothetical protein